MAGAKPWVLLLALSASLLGPAAMAAANVFDETVLHPAIPLLDEEGRHVLETGRPYSTRTSCGNGSGGGCHDYERMGHAYHFEQGRAETRDEFGARRGLGLLVGPGYFGGYNCMQGSMAAVLSKKANADAEEFGDYGAAGMIRACGSCHFGGGWEERDRFGMRYDQMPDAGVAAWDGDYFDRADPSSVVRWDWRRSGVREADCLFCHADFGLLRKFPESGLGSNDDKSVSAFEHWGLLQDGKFIQAGWFRYANSALFEFLNVRPDLPSGQSLLTVARKLRPGTPEPDYDLVLDQGGAPILHWNRAAFDGNGKVRIPMRRFPGNDNCMTCHFAAHDSNRTQAKRKSTRRSFYGFGDGTQLREDAGQPVFDPKVDYRTDVHKGKSWSENGETRVIDNCNACHAKQYYKPSWMNVDLDADHDFPKGNGDADVRNDLDYLPGPFSCIYCHDAAPNRALPSGQKTLLDAHRERWKAAGYFTGYAPSAYNRTVQVHFDDLDCQACHNHTAISDDSVLPLHYRYRERGDGKLRVVPYIPNARFYVQDRVSGRMLYRYERLAVLRRETNAQGQMHGVIVDPATGEVTGRVDINQGEFELPATYADFVALKLAYDHLLQGKGYADADVRFVFTESNDYLFTHQTRPASSAVACTECHNKRPDGSINGAVAANGLMGESRLIEVGRIPDRRLVDEGIVELAQPYHQVQPDGRITENVGKVLEVTAKAPDLSILRAATSRIVSGALRPFSAEEAFAFAGLDEEAANLLRSQGEKGTWFAFVARSGPPPLRGLGVLVFAAGANRFLEDGLWVDADVHEPEAIDRKRIRRLGAGKPVADLYGLTFYRDGGIATAMNGDLWVKLPYPATQGEKLDVVFSPDGRRWRKLSRKEFGIFPATTERAGYLLARLRKPATVLSVVARKKK